MFGVNDVVMYGTAGICIITAVEKRSFSGKVKEYYVLKDAEHGKNTYYIPTDNESALDRLHPVCSKAEADELISHMNSEGLIWIDNDIRRREEYSRIIKEADKRELIMLIKTLYLHRRELTENGRKLRSADENYLRLAEDMLFGEFAYALGIDRSEVVEYIEKHIA